MEDVEDEKENKKREFENMKRYRCSEINSKKEMDVNRKFNEEHNRIQRETDELSRKNQEIERNNRDVADSIRDVNENMRKIENDKRFNAFKMQTIEAERNKLMMENATLKSMTQQKRQSIKEKKKKEKEMIEEMELQDLQSCINKNLNSQIGQHQKTILDYKSKIENLNLSIEKLESKNQDLDAELELIKNNLLSLRKVYDKCDIAYYEEYESVWYNDEETENGYWRLNAAPNFISFPSCKNYVNIYCSIREVIQTKKDKLKDLQSFYSSKYECLCRVSSSRGRVGLGHSILKIFFLTF